MQLLFRKTMKKVLAERGYKHLVNDDEFSRHGEYARNMQYAFSKEFSNGHERVVDVIFLAADLRVEKLVIGFIRENMSMQNGVIENNDVSIPFAKLSIDEFEKQLDRLIPKKLPVEQRSSGRHTF